ncbi:hypothetical protein KCU81_g700, partial [Aureobasidium melanogenum]
MTIPLTIHPGPERVLKTINLKSLANSTEDEENLHFNHIATRSNRPADAVQETKVSSPHVSHTRIAIDEASLCTQISPYSPARHSRLVSGLTMLICVLTGTMPES